MTASARSSGGESAEFPNREEYEGVSCRPIDVSPGPADAHRGLKLRCALDTLAERSETGVRRVGVRGLGLCEKVAKLVGFGELFRQWYISFQASERSVIS